MDHNITGLNIQMHYFLLMQLNHSLCDLLHQKQRLLFHIYL